MGAISSLLLCLYIVKILVNNQIGISANIFSRVHTFLRVTTIKAIKKLPAHVNRELYDLDLHHDDEFIGFGYIKLIYGGKGEDRLRLDLGHRQRLDRESEGSYEDAPSMIRSGERVATLAIDHIFGASLFRLYEISVADSGQQRFQES